MALASIEQLLKRHMGLHSATVGSGTIHQAVEQRMRDCNLQHPEDYLNILQHSLTELDALIDTVVIPETWFFRDVNPFVAFSGWLREEWLPGHVGVQLRVLSVPCSTGEEPYTLAMCLSDAGLPAAAAHIDAVDISRVNIDKARRANYGNNSFRGGDLGFRERHFQCDNQRYLLKEDIRKRVNFERANILDGAFLQQRQPYHVIFCRNLLIYFDRPTQNAAIERLESALTRDGVLFLGHSETSLLLERDFSPLNYARCFAFKRGRSRGDDAGGEPALRSREARPKTRRRQPQPDAVRPFVSASAAPLAPQTPAPQNDGQQLLQEAFQLADQGHLDEAALHCEKLLQRHSLQPDAHYLLGLIREATGNRRAAEQHLRKAVYLSPEHYEALTHLAVICQRDGDADGARRFQQRADRIRQRKRPAESVK